MDENEQQYGTDFKHIAQLGQRGSDEGDIGEFKGRFNRHESNEEKFTRKIQADIATLRIPLEPNDFPTIERLIKSDPRIKFKNPLAFLLGYLVVRNNKLIKETDVDEMYGLCAEFVKNLTANDRVKYVSFTSIRKADIIRYANFISKYI